MLRAAAAAMKEAHGQYLDFRRGPDGSALMTPGQFNEMRVWLAPTVVGGRALYGANAAYLAEMVVTDFLIGTADDDYRNYTETFSMYQSPDERAFVSEVRSEGSLVEILAAALGCNSLDSLMGLAPSDIAERVRRGPVALTWTLQAFKDLVDEFVGSSGAHIGLIHVYLEKYGESLSADELLKMPVKPDGGTGGHSHDQTRRIHDMRRKSLPVRKILEALRMARVELAA